MSGLCYGKMQKQTNRLEITMQKAIQLNVLLVSLAISQWNFLVASKPASVVCLCDRPKHKNEWE